MISNCGPSRQVYTCICSYDACVVYTSFFFFQAEDGIRDLTVTGVQTCALPISLANFVTGLRDLPQLAAPGSVWSYNNAGFGVAGRVIELESGKSIQDRKSVV